MAPKEIKNYVCVAHVCGLHSCCTVLLPSKERVTTYHFGLPEPLPVYLIMYNQKNGNRHTGRLWSEIFTPSRFVCVFFFLALLGLGEKCKFISCYVCLAFKRKSRLKCFWYPVALTLWLGRDCFHQGKFPTDLTERSLVVRYLGAQSTGYWLGYIPVVSTRQLYTEGSCPFGPLSTAS